MPSVIILIPGVTRIYRIAKNKTKTRRGRRNNGRGQLTESGPPNSLMTLSRGLGFPRKLRVRHRYTEPISIGLSAGATSTYLWSCNGMYDPNITSTGSQPMYFDQLSAIYDHYTVFNSRLRLDISCPSSVRYAFYVDDDTSVATTVQQASQQVGAILGMHLSTAVRPTSITRSWNAKDYFGGDVFDNDNLQGTASANPSEQSYYTIAIAALDIAATPTVDILVTLEFDAVWDELKTMATS